MEFLSSCFTENHLLKGSSIGQQETSYDSKIGFENLFSQESVETEKTIENEVSQSSHNHLLSVPSEKNLSFQGFESLKLDVFSNSLVFSSEPNISENVLNIENLFSSHFL